MNAPADLLVDRVRARLAADPGELTPHRVAQALRTDGVVAGDATVLDVFERLRRDVVGAGPLEPLLALAGVTDVLVNGCEEVWIDRGSGLERTDVRFADDAAVRRLAVRLAAGAGRRLDDGVPYADLRLADGTRFHAVLAPLARPGTLVSLRVPARRDLDLAALCQAGSLGPQALVLLRRLVASRVSFVVSGGTGSGKTTLLAALLGELDPRERLVVVEDASELRPRHPHTVALEARPANVEGSGRVDLATLVRQALRMRPDRLVVGEVRGPEVVELLAALNTGHEGGCGTLHANSVRDVPARFEALGVAAGLPRAAVHSQLAAGLDAVLHLRRGRDGVRRLAEVGVLERAPDGGVRVEVGARLGDDGDLLPGPAADRLARRLEQP